MEEHAHKFKDVVQVLALSGWLELFVVGILVLVQSQGLLFCKRALLPGASAASVHGGCIDIHNFAFIIFLWPSAI